MKIAAMSDSHDQLDSLNKAIEIVEEKNIERILFCGDFCSPVPVKKCFADFSGKIDAVFGNTEDRMTITKLSLTDVKNLTIHGEHAELEIAGKRIAMTHYPLYGKSMAASGDYDFVFHGHNHTHSIEKIDQTHLINPGEIAGFFEQPRFVIVDLVTEKVEIIEV